MRPNVKRRAYEVQEDNLKRPNVKRGAYELKLKS